MPVHETFGIEYDKMFQNNKSEPENYQVYPRESTSVPKKNRNKWDPIQLAIVIDSSTNISIVYSSLPWPLCHSC